MDAENFDLEHIMESRRKAVASSLREIGIEELRNLESKIFPYAGHPWAEIYHGFLSENASCAFFHAAIEEAVQILYCRAKEKGIWFKPGTGVGILQARGLAVMKELVDHR